MKRFLLRIIVCVVPTLLSIGVVAWAYHQYDNGRGGFRLGVDLVGGTILVYEVDEARKPDNFKAEDLAAALKRRIDPTDLYNITIRPVEGTPPRVEIILPTGGKHQAEAERRNWLKVLEKAREKYPGNPYATVKKGDKASLIQAIQEANSDTKQAEIAAWVEKNANHRDWKKANDDDWKNVLAAALKEFPATPTENPYAEVKKSGGAVALREAIIQANPGVDADDVQEWVEKNTDAGSKDRRLLTSEEVERIKNEIERQGRLEFRILANTTDDAEAINAAEKWFKSPQARAELERAENRNEPPPSPRREDGGQTFPLDPNRFPDEPQHTYSWVEVGKSELWSLHLNSEALKNNPILKNEVDQALAKGESFRIRDNLFFVREIKNWTRRTLKDRDEYGKRLEFFILVRDPLKDQEISGDFLVNATAGMSSKGGLAIHFCFNTEGGNRFYELTTKNKPTGGRETGFRRQLAIIFDGQVISAPTLNEPIRTNGEISGNFTQDDIDFMVRTLRAGALPATLKKEPVSQNSMGATLGAETIRSGTWSVLFAFVAVLAFMIFYYRGAGVVACVALFANLLMTVAFMVVVQAAFTLPGLAGLVLMLGMAVDANVLIYERLREERDRGANLALAIRNGYDRAFPTIVDTHLSSIFTAIVLYVVGNDQLKGFGISLTVGLIISLFTSLYMTRTIFEIWLAKGWLKNLTFFNGLVRLIHAKYWDFMAIRYYWFTGTIILTVLGAALFIYRMDSDPESGKSSVLNIDFIGGTAYGAQLATPMPMEELRKKLEREDLPQDQRLPDLSLEANPVSSDTDTGSDKVRIFTVRTSERDMKKVFKYVEDNLGHDLKRLRMKYRITQPGKEAVLVFTTQDGKTLDYASPAQVQMLVADAFGAHDLSRAGFSVDRPSGNPYAMVKKGDKAGLIQAILEYHPDAKRADVAAWVEKNAGDSDWDRVLTAAAKEYPVTLSREEHYSELILRVNEPLSTDSKRAEALFKTILDDVEAAFAKAPQPERLENFDKQLAANTQERAMYAILASWAAILLYLWFRFGNWTFGAATVLCLIHDLFFTLGMIAVCHYIHDTWLGRALLIQDFKIDLQSVAALLTLVGYSVNDTIVVFDRIREVRGKNPALTPQIINDSVNQTLTRTILASTTVWLVVIVLYIWGGEGVHLFAFVMVVGVVVGTYSSIYIASPLLLIFGEGRVSQSQLDRAAAHTAGTQAK
jgi:SecD/SecF fusion protein